jgi:hypothetical protein
LKAANPLAGACGSMTTAANAPAALKPFVPANLASGATFCEEVFVDPSEAGFINSNGLMTLSGQLKWSGSTGKTTIDTPTTSVEIKADWLPAASLKTPFTCSNPPSGVYAETIDGKCYALVGMHLTSKLLTNWLWATFEPQNSTTNPNRCDPALYDDCNDQWGSSPAQTGKGGTSQATQALINLMTQAGLPKVFQNYRLTGVETAYMNGSQANLLGNSFVELNARVPPHQASCMTCHAQANVTKGPKQNGIAPPLVGNPHPPGAGWISQDFSWMLGSMPASRTAAPNAKTPDKKDK